MANLPHLENVGVFFVFWGLFFLVKMPQACSNKPFNLHVIYYRSLTLIIDLLVLVSIVPYTAVVFSFFISFVFYFQILTQWHITSAAVFTYLCGVCLCVRV